ncbi:MAG: cation diffusion facilitator family transporter [Firmicutes bacterium]|nr:cation diffusion facilitator family transporter [Bacillota bacterium]
MNKDRQKIITRTSIIGILTNLAIASVKIICGLLVNSIAIVSEGINNASDSASSFIMLIASKLSNKKPDKDHPFGYGRIEYLSGVVIGIIILLAGISLIKESIDGIVNPSELQVTIAAIGVVVFSAIVKYILGAYTQRKGEAVESEALIAIGKDSKNDSFISIITIASSVIFLLTGLSLDAYAGLIFSLVILKTAYETLKNTADDLIGRPGKEELARQLIHEIRETEGIYSVADMMLHSYGPERYSGSVNVEVDHKKTIGEVYEFLHELQLRIMHEYGVTLVFGIYAVDEDSDYMRQLRSTIAEFARNHEHIKSYHAVYLSKASGRIYCDFIVDYNLNDWDALEAEFAEYMGERYPDNTIELTIETEFV